MKSIALPLAMALAAAQLLPVSVPPALAAPPAAPSADARALANAVQNFQLTTGYLERSRAMRLEIARDPCAHGNPTTAIRLYGAVAQGQLGMKQAIAKYAALPGMRALLARYGLSASDAFVGGFALMDASMRRMGGTSDQPPTAVERKNVAFLAAHPSGVAAYRAKERAIVDARLQANGGKLPACERQLLGGMRQDQR